MEQTHDLFQIDIAYVYAYAYAFLRFHLVQEENVCVYGKTILKETMEEHEAVLGQRPILSLIN